MKQRWFVLLMVAALAVGVVGFALVGVTKAAPEIACFSNGTGGGNWSVGSTWSGCTGTGGVPASIDTVTIRDGDTVTINTSPTVAGLTIGQGVSGVLIFDSAAARSLTVAGNITINSGGTLITQAATARTHAVFISGDLTNNGIFDMSRGGTTLVANATFNGGANQTISGSGGTTRFYQITINNTGTSPNNVVDIATSSFSAANPFLTVNAGILRMSGSFTFSNAFFMAAGYSINSDEGLWLNNPNVTVTGQNGTPTLAGYLRITNGTYNVGTSSGNSLEYGGSTGTFIMEGGIVRIAGRFSGTGTTQVINFNMSGGSMTVGTIENGAGRGTFDIPAAGSSFTMSGGTIILQTRSTTTGTQLDYRNVAGTVNITGGTVQFGNSSTTGSPIFYVGTTSGPTSQLPSVLINATGTPNLTPRTAIVVNGNWTNNSSFTSGTNTVTFNGTSAQTIGGSSSTTFNNLTIANTNATGVTLNTATTVSGATTVNAGSVLATNPTFTANGPVSVPGSFQINQGAWATGTGAWNYGSTGTLIFNNSSGAYDVNGTDVYWPASNGPVNVRVPGAGGVTLNAARTVNGVFQTSAPIVNGNNLTLNGTLQLDGGSSFTGAPTYGSASTLLYNCNCTYGRTAEWTSTSGAGYPANVRLSSNTILNYPNGVAVARALAGNLTIDSGSALYMDYGMSNMNQPLTIGGNVTLDGNLSLGSTGDPGIGGDLYVGGNWTKNSSSNFYPNGRAVFFNGTGNQAIGGSSVTNFDYLIINGSARVIFPSTNIPTVANIMTVNTGAILTQTATVNNSTFNFLTISTDKFRGIDVTSPNNLGPVIVTLKVTTDGGCTTTGTSSPRYATRCYDIAAAPGVAATVTLWALDSERNGVEVANLAPYHYSGGTWAKLTNLSNGTGSGGYVYATGDTTSFSPFLLADTNNAPTAITLSTFSGRTPTHDGWIVVILLIAGMLLIGGWALRRRSLRE